MGPVLNWPQPSDYRLRACLVRRRKPLRGIAFTPGKTDKSSRISRMSLTERHDMMTGQATDWDGGMGEVGDYIALLKPRVMSLVVFTAFVGMMMAPGSIHPVLAVVALLCITIGAGASGALNMWFDADIDRVMSRTAKRPIPAGKITPSEALAFGLTLSAGSVLTLGLVVNWFAGAFLAFTIFFYVVIYTMWLKRSTPQNIVIGGAAGAFPPMIGWAAVTGGVSVESVLMFEAWVTRCLCPSVPLICCTCEKVHL